MSTWTLHKRLTKTNINARSAKKVSRTFTTLIDMLKLIMRKLIGSHQNNLKTNPNHFNVNKRTQKWKSLKTNKETHLQQEMNLDKKSKKSKLISKRQQH